MLPAYAFSCFHLITLRYASSMGDFHKACPVNYLFITSIYNTQSKNHKSPNESQQTQSTTTVRTAVFVQLNEL